MGGTQSKVGNGCGWSLDPFAVKSRMHGMLSRCSPDAYLEESVALGAL